MSILAKSPDLTDIINKAIKRIGENHSLSRDNKGTTITNKDIEVERNNTTKVIEEALKAVANEMAEKMVLENTIDGMVKDTIKESTKNDKVQLEESVTNTIKKLVNKKLKGKVQSEQNISNQVPGLDAYKKATKKSKSEADSYHKDVKKKFKEYETFEGSESPEFPHQENSKTNADGQFQYYRNDDKDQEFVDDFAHPGLIDFDTNNLNLDRLTKYLEGSSETGNAQTDKDGEALGNVIPSETGKKMLKSSESRKEKIAKEKAAMSNLRGYTPDVQKVTNVKEEVSQDITDMKKLWDYNKITQ
tara:strand:- start:1175 stop:2083 length:909 start_codon:yes stop_codon:yes gene_type:complete